MDILPLVIGLFIGLVLGLTGAGGSVFAVPLLMLFAGQSMTEAVGISLGAVAASTLYASLRGGLHRQLLWTPGLILAAAGALTTPLGRWLGDRLPESWLLLAFALLASLIAGRMWWTSLQQPEAAQVVRASSFSDAARPELLCNLSKTGQFELRFRCLSGLIVGGLITGLLAGLFGVGGGFLIVPLLLALSPVTMKQAVSTSLLIIALISSAGFGSHLLLVRELDWRLSAMVAAAAIVGMILGQGVSRRVANARLQQVFALGLFVVSVITLLRFW